VELQSKVAVVIPTLNEAPTIVDLVKRTCAHSRHVIVVDDASSDGTADLLSDLPVTVLRHADTEGKGAGLVTGFREALKRDVSAVITLDGDGQHRPEDIPKFLARAKQKPGKIIIGSRLTDKAAFPPSRYRANRIANFWISWASGHPIEDSQSGFRLYPREVLESVRASHGRRHGFVFESEILINAAHAGYRSTAVSIPALYDGAAARSSHFRPFADISKIVVMVALKLLSRGMYPEGLYHALRGRRPAGP
jgi:glycosyltransferase involved in cell wall biosynthesis